MTDKYVPAIGDRVRTVEGVGLSRAYVGVVSQVGCDKDILGTVHPIRITADDDWYYWATEVELIETAAEIAEYEEGMKTYALPQRFVCGVDPSDAFAHPARLSAPEREDMSAWYTATGEAEEVRVTSATGGQKGQKPAQLSTVDAVALLKLAEVGGYGGRKYEPHNYLRGYAWSLSLDALFRHILAFESGEDLDPESGLPHVTHAAWHCLALTSFMERGLGTDDRFKQDGV